MRRRLQEPINAEPATGLRFSASLNMIKIFKPVKDVKDINKSETFRNWVPFLLIFLFVCLFL